MALSTASRHDVAPTSQRSPAQPWVAATLIGAVVVVLLGVLLGYRDIDVWGGLLLPLGLFAVIAPVVAAIERRQPEPLVGMVVAALAARLVGAWVRFLVSFYVYSKADADLYHRTGAAIARRFHQGDLTLAELVPRGTSTRFIYQLTGLVEVVIGPSILGSFMVFTVLSYVGALLMLHAARAAIPQLLARRYAALILFLPSMLYWPSSLGKDGPLQLAVGLAALGTARILTGRARGWLWLAAGLYLAGAIRPHVAVLLVAAATVAFVSRSSDRASRLGPIPKVLGIGLLLVGLTTALGALGDTFGGFDYGNPIGATGAILDSTQTLTSTGGSELEVGNPNSPLAYPLAAFTVLFRPLIVEADSVTTAASALEGTFLLVLAWYRRADLRRGIALVRTNRYIRFVLVYSVTFSLAWGSVHNLGIIARQRVMMLPLLLTLVCIAPTTGTRETP